MRSSLVRLANETGGQRPSRPASELRFFCDRDLGAKIFPGKLAESGVDVVSYSEIYEVEDTPDQEWISNIGERGWVALSHDKRIRRKRLERKAVYDYSCRLFIFFGDVPTAELADWFVCAYSDVLRFVDDHDPPFIARIVRRSRRGQPDRVVVDPYRLRSDLEREFG